MLPRHIFSGQDRPDFKRAYRLNLLYYVSDQICFIRRRF